MVSEKRKLQIGSSCVKRRSRRHVYINLPIDVVFNILVYLPADILYNVMRYVCQEWYDVIKSPGFIASHLEIHSTTNSLLIHNDERSGYVVKAGSHGLLFEVKNLNFQFLNKAWGSCNGLLFVIGPKQLYSNCPSYVVNPLIKEYLPLPIFPGYLGSDKCCFGYAAGSRLYKVMITPSYKASECYILSVGVDKAWRQIEAVFQLSDCAKKLMRLSYRCLTLRGYVYWLEQSFSFILRFNMETETFDEIHGMPPYDLSDCAYGIFAMENSICLWAWRWEKYLFEFWLLKDPEIISGHGQWEKLIKINVRGQKRLQPCDNHMPIWWLRSMELLVFRGKAEILVYDVNTRKVHQTKDMKRGRVDVFYGDFYSQHHVQSLVPINNLSLVTRPERPFKAQSEVYSEEEMRPEFDKSKKPYWCTR